MRVPLSWLKELTPVDADVETLAGRLHDLGLIVENIERPAKLDNVVVAEVRECHEIEGAKKVQLVVVDDGMGQREVMCGAFNFGPGDRVPLALPGAVLPDGMRIDAREVKSLGVTSHGMLCAADELGVGDDHSGILLFDGSAAPGTSVADVLGLSDTVIELEITPNRPDCMGMVGVAREVAAAFGLPLRVPDCTVDAGDLPIGEAVSVEVDDHRRCPRYVAALVENVTIGPSPAWMQARLRACGMRPINNVVDVTNYVMLEWGQPLHAFDLDRLAGPAIVVRDARESETLTTLDGEVRQLTTSDLLICDAEKPVAIAGVMGGENSEVGPETGRILLESANFSAPSVMRTAKRLGLRTEASARFERGVDPGVCEAAALRAAALLVEHAGGTARRGVLDVMIAEPEQRLVDMRPTRVNSLLGTDLEPAKMTELLAGIEVDSVEDRGESVLYRIPTWRVDLEREIDLVEEVARLHNYNNVPRTLPGGRDRVGGLTPIQKAERRLRVALLSAGAHEALTTTFVSDELLEKTGQVPGALVSVLNPLQEENRYLRPSLVPNLLQSASYNVARGARSVRLAEIGTVFERSDRVLPLERTMLGVVYCGADLDSRVHGGGRSREYDVYDLKGFLESTAEDMGLDLQIDTEVRVGPELHPGRSAGVTIAGQAVGTFGQLNPTVASAFDLPEATFVAEISVDPLLHAHAGHAERFRSLSPYPAAAVDLAFVVAEDVAAGAVAGAVAEGAGSLCRVVDLFDVYRGEPLESGHKSLAFEVLLQSDERTLTDDDVKAAVDGAVASAAELGARLRT